MKKKPLLKVWIKKAPILISVLTTLFAIWCFSTQKQNWKSLNPCFVVCYLHAKNSTDLRFWKKKKNHSNPFQVKSYFYCQFTIVVCSIRKILISALWQHCTCLVPLQAKNPNIRINPPRADNGTEWPGMGTGRPFLSNLPILGPMRTQPTNAQTAEKKKIIGFHQN